MTPEPTYNFQNKKVTHSLTTLKKAVRVLEDGPLIEAQHSTSLPDLIGRHLLVEYCGRHELGHVPVAAQVDGAP